MTAATAPAIDRDAAMGTGGVTQARVVASEWVKLRSLRSTYYSFLAAIVCVIGLGAVFGAVRANDINEHSARGLVRVVGFDATAVSLRGIYLAQIAIGVLGALAITGEYSTGMIRATLAAVPRRLPVLWAKLGVYAVVVFVVGLVASLAGFLAGQAALASAHVQASLSTPGAVRAIFGGALYLTTVALLSIGLGFLLRSTAGAIATLLGLLLVLPVLAQALPATMYAHVFKYLPMPAGQAIVTTIGRPSIQDPSSLSPWAGLGVFVLYAVAAIVGGVIVLARRDA